MTRVTTKTDEEEEGSVSPASPFIHTYKWEANEAHSHSRLLLKNEILKAPEASRQEERGEFTARSSSACGLQRWWAGGFNLVVFWIYLQI